MFVDTEPIGGVDLSTDHPVEERNKNEANPAESHQSQGNHSQSNQLNLKNLQLQTDRTDKTITVPSDSDTIMDGQIGPSSTSLAGANTRQ